MRQTLVILQLRDQLVKDHRLCSLVEHGRLYLYQHIIGDEFFPVNHLHWYWQTNQNNQETEHTNNMELTQRKKGAIVNSTTDTLKQKPRLRDGDRQSPV